MTTYISNHSTYPRIGDRPEQQSLRRAVDQWEGKEISDEALEGVLREVTTEVISEQDRAGIDLVTDGGLRRYDPISQWIKEFKGVRLGRLLRFLDTNTYFRIPTVEKPLRRREFEETSFLQRDTGYALEALRSISPAGKRLKVFLTGPVTLSLCCERGRGFRKIEDLVQELSLLMAEEVSRLVTAGATWIQIEEPMILQRPELFPSLSKGLKKIASKKGSGKILLATYFGDAAAGYAKLQDLPVDGLGLDCVSGSGLIETIAAKGSDKTLALGVIDGRSMRMEDEKVVEKLATRIRRVRAPELHLTTSCGLEYLPRGRAFEKLTLLKRLKELVQ